MRVPTILLGLIALAACAAPAVISDINASFLRIKASALTPHDQITQKAHDGCAIYGKEPVPVSSSCVDTNCDYQELLFACRGPNRSIAFDGKWVAEGQDDGCGSSWAMEIDILNGRARGVLWRGWATYDFEGRLDSEGRLIKVLAGKTEASNGIVGPRFITVNATFAEETATGDYSMRAFGPTTCTAAVKLSRHPT